MTMAPPRSSNGSAGMGGTTLPPNTDLELERLVLGCCFAYTDRSVADALAGGLHADHFAGIAHKEVWRQMVDLHAGGKPWDLPALWSQRLGPMVDHGLLHVEQPDLIAWMVDGVAPTTIPTHVEHLVELHARRTATYHLQIATQAAAEGDEEAYTAALERAAAARTVGGQGDSSWRPVDVAAILDGSLDVVAPSILARTDGIHLLYPGVVHAVNATPEAGKTWLAMYACVEQLARGEHVLYLDFETTPTAALARMHRDLGVDRATLTERFHYARPDDPLDAAASQQIDALLEQHQPTLVVLDGVTEIMVLHGWSISDNDDVARFIAALPRRMIRFGAACLLIDHVVKDKEQRGRYAIGGQHKLAGVDVAYSLDQVEPFGRGRPGRSRLTVQKDRGGHVRSACPPGTDIVADVHYATTDNDLFDVTITRPGDDIHHQWDGPTQCADAALDMLTQDPDGTGWYTPPRLVDLLRARGSGYRPDTVRQSLERLVLEGRARSEPWKRGSRRYMAGARLVALDGGNQQGEL